MIYQITNALLIPKLLDLMKALETDPVLLQEIMIQSLARSDSRIFVEEKDGQARGFIFATVETFEGKESVFIQSCSVKPDDNERLVCFELLARIRKWGSELGLKDMFFMTRRSPEAFKRKYHFKYHTTVLRRSL